MTSYNSEVETDIETDSLLSEEETDDYSLNEENDFYDPEEQSLTKYNIVLCERYNQNIHGIWDDGICNNDINKYYLTQYRLKKYNKYLINDIKRLNPRFKTEIAECIVLPSQYNISILKTFWLRLVQRVWKKIFMERKIVEEHLKCCIHAGLNISGINAEVATGQWEFQIGPSESISAADELVVARYLLQRVAEKYGATIDYSPKISDSANGSGCHINFSTEKMRNEDGFQEILHCMKKLESKHAEHIAVYGENNHKRLTGLHETSSMDIFTWGIGTRNTSVRIPNATYKNCCGYFEDRRPAANIDPYLATSIIAKTCCLDSL